MKKITALVLCLALLLCLGACTKKGTDDETKKAETAAQSESTAADRTEASVTETEAAATEAETAAATTAAETAAEAEGLWKNAVYTADTDLGEGAVSFAFKVTADDKTVTFHVSTDKKTVGEALQELNLIQGDVGDYGLMVNVVNGISADYDADGFYWAFYVGEEYAAKGIDQTEIEAGTEYAMVRTAA